MMKKLTIPVFALVFAAMMITVPVLAAPVAGTEKAEKTWVLDGNITYAEVWRLGRIIVLEGTLTLPNGTPTNGTFLFLWHNGKRNVIRLQDGEFHWNMTSCDLHVDRAKIDLNLTWNTGLQTSKVHRETSNENWSLTIDGSGRPARVRGTIQFSQGTTRHLFGRGAVFQCSAVVTRVL